MNKIPKLESGKLTAEVFATGIDVRTGGDAWLTERQTYTGYPDFIGGKCVTLSPGGPGRIVTCWKCPKCGYSFAPVAQLDRACDTIHEWIKKPYHLLLKPGTL
jgi:hypothetical protein